MKYKIVRHDIEFDKYHVVATTVYEAYAHQICRLLQGEYHPSFKFAVVIEEER